MSLTGPRRSAACSSPTSRAAIASSTPATTSSAVIASASAVPRPRRRGPRPATARARICTPTRERCPNRTCGHVMSRSSSDSVGRRSGGVRRTRNVLARRKRRPRSRTSSGSQSSAGTGIGDRSRAIACTSSASAGGAPANCSVRTVASACGPPRITRIGRPLSIRSRTSSASCGSGHREKLVALSWRIRREPSKTIRALSHSIAAGRLIPGEAMRTGAACHRRNCISVAGRRHISQPSSGSSTNPARRATAAA